MSTIIEETKSPSGKDNVTVSTKEADLVRERIKDVFNEYDVGRTGYITINEIKGFMDRCCQNLK